MCNAMMDGSGDMVIEDDHVTVTSFSGGEKVVQTWRLKDADAMISLYFRKRAEYDGRPVNVVAFLKAS